MSIATQQYLIAALCALFGLVPGFFLMRRGAGRAVVLLTLAMGGALGLLALLAETADGWSALYHVQAIRLIVLPALTGMLLGAGLGALTRPDR